MSSQSWNEPLPRDLALPPPSWCWPRVKHHKALTPVHTTGFSLDHEVMQKSLTEMLSSSLGLSPKDPFVEMWVHDHNLQDAVRYMPYPSHCLQIPTLHPCATATLPPIDAHLTFNEKRMFGLVICTTSHGLCIRYFSAAVTKCHNEKQLTERRVLEGSQFLGESPWWGGRHDSRCLEQEAERSDLHTYTTNRNWIESKMRL